MYDMLDSEKEYRNTKENDACQACHNMQNIIPHFHCSVCGNKW